eukprot:4183510-Amphidinium_carterae.1
MHRAGNQEIGGKEEAEPKGPKASKGPLGRVPSAFGTTWNSVLRAVNASKIDPKMSRPKEHGQRDVRAGKGQSPSLLSRLD